MNTLCLTYKQITKYSFIIYITSADIFGENAPLSKHMKEFGWIQEHHSVSCIRDITDVTVVLHNKQLSVFGHWYNAYGKNCIVYDKYTMHKMDLAGGQRGHIQGVFTGWLNLAQLTIFKLISSNIMNLFHPQIRPVIARCFYILRGFKLS
jgi:hypothetical protein